jgi:hypothetical protein
MLAILAAPPLKPPFLAVFFDRNRPAFRTVFFVTIAKTSLLLFISCLYATSGHTFLSIMPHYISLSKFSRSDPEKVGGISRQPFRVNLIGCVRSSPENPLSGLARKRFAELWIVPRVLFRHDGLWRQAAFRPWQSVAARHRRSDCHELDQARADL